MGNAGFEGAGLGGGAGTVSYRALLDTGEEIRRITLGDVFAGQIISFQNCIK